MIPQTMIDKLKRTITNTREKFQVKGSHIHMLMEEIDRLRQIINPAPRPPALQAWRNPSLELPPYYVIVVVKLECGYERVARLAHGDIWQYASFLGDVKTIPIEQRNNRVVGWEYVCPGDH